MTKTKSTEPADLTVTFTVAPLNHSGPGGNEINTAIADLARHVSIEADRLEKAFGFAADDAPIRVTIANLRALAKAVGTEIK